MRTNFKQIQGISHSSFHQYSDLQDLIWHEKKVRCTCVVTPDHVSIKTSDYADFLLAKAAIRSRVSVDIVRDVQG